MSKNSNPASHFSALLVLIVLFSAVFLYLALNHANKQLNNAYLHWQNKISLLSNIKHESLSKWFNSKEVAINNISNNVTVKMYLTELSSGKTIAFDDKIVQEEFLKNYLTSESQKHGFSNSDASRKELKVNIKKTSNAGIAILDTAGKLIVAKDFEDNLLALLKLNKEQLLKGGKASKVLQYKGKNYFATANKVAKLQSEEISGYIVGIKELNKEITEILAFPTEDFQTAISSIVLNKNNQLNYILASSPLSQQENVSVLKKAKNAVEAAITKPNEILINKHGSHNVLIIAKQLLDNEQLYLTYKISENEALADAFAVRKSVIATAVLALIAIILVIFLVWKHSSSLKYKKLSSEFEQKNKLLKLVTENQIQKMFILDSDNIVRFANNKFAQKFDIEPEALLGKYLKDILGPAKAEEYTKINGKFKNRTTPLIATGSSFEGKKQVHFETKFIPLEDSLEGNGAIKNGSLIIENDITKIIEEQLKRENNLNSIMKILIRIVEERSIYYHSHSELVTELSLKIAHDLKLNDKEIKALEISARLCHLYLVLLPITILNKKGKLTNEEQKMVEECPQKTVEIIRQINFDAPVLETIEQMNERVDGNGSLGLKGNKLIVTAKILKVANDYIAMISPRAYRKKLNQETALEEMLQNRGKKYDEKIVYSLASNLQK